MKRNIFHDSQYGFHEKCSTEHAILYIINQTENSMDNRMYLCAIFVYLKKAFDTVDQLIFLQKLDHYGVHRVTNNWFASYMLGQQQTIQIGIKTYQKGSNTIRSPSGVSARTVAFPHLHK